MINVGMVAGSVGFTWTWDPLVGQTTNLFGSASTVNIPSLTGYACTMSVRLSSATSSPYSAFPMTVATNGLTAAYVTQAATDFPVGGVYDIVFVASKSDGTKLVANPVRVKVSQGL